jgi:cytidylate kinase
MKKILITIDGPSGSGKSTVGRALAQDLNIEFFSSGSLYRAIAYYLKNKVRVIDSISLDSLDPLIIKINEQIIYEDNLYSKEVNQASSQIAQQIEIRNIVSNALSNIYENSINGLVIEGRDMGSVVFPNANLKIYLDASQETRGQRRQKQTSDESLIDLISRDERDKNREHSPLVIPKDSFVILNEEISIEQIISDIKEKLKTL